MDFNKLINERIVPIFELHGFHIAEQFKNYTCFKSDSVEAAFSYNELDRTTLFEIGKLDDFRFPINNNAMNQVFDSNIKIEQQSKEEFVDNVVLFLHESGDFIFKGNLNKLNQFRKFVEKESDTYTTQLFKRQNLSAANQAWDNGNYKEFIKLIEAINIDSIEPSYKLKYKIAKQKLTSSH